MISEIIGDNFKFKNRAPEDKEWSAHIRLLNEWSTPERLLREIIQYARAGVFYPADMHVDLIDQVITATRPERIVKAQDERELSRIIGEAAGAVSMCWHPRPAGVFQGEKAAVFVEDAVKELMGKGPKK